MLESSSRSNTPSERAQLSREPVTVLIHTRNEADQIRECLDSVSWAEEVIMLDSFSDDGTFEIVADEYPHVDLRQRESKGSAAQKNFGMMQATHDWILVIDADERVTPELRREIEETLADPRFRAYSVPRRNYMLGKHIRYSGLQNDRVTRLFHRDHARYPNRRVHADMVVNGEVGVLTAPFLHNYVRSLNHLVDKMKRYGIWGGAQIYRDRRRPGILDLAGRPAWRFFRDWILARGFLDGWRGFVLSGFNALYTFFKYSKAMEYFDAEERGESPDLPPFEEDQKIWELPWEQRSEPR